MLFLYLTVLVVALYYVVKLLGPEMSKTSSSKTAVVSSKADVSSQSYETDKGTERLQILLAEKNSEISLLQSELKIFQAQVRDFDKFKTLLDEEMHHLREQNRIFRSELGMPTVTAQAGGRGKSILESF